ncbi:MAG: GNAT family N-acetyltransferase [Acidobacteria bacterium]|nr:GNAT family N-acetyltransferase [Acidobacteriota bacterium]
MRTIEIGPAIERDVPVILDLIRQFAEYERLSHVVTATEEQLRATLFGERPFAETLLAFYGGECVGFALYFTNYSTFVAKPGLYLEDLFVKPHARGKGIGRALLRRLAQIAAERGYWRIDWVVLDWNQPAIEFYKRLGAVPMDEWTTFRLTGDSLRRLALR